MLRHILRAIDLKLRLEFLTKSQLKVLVTVINKSGAQSAHLIEESEKRTKQVISKSLSPLLPHSSLSLFSTAFTAIIFSR